jgi:hypothetical protein
VFRLSLWTLIGLCHVRINNALKGEHALQINLARTHRLLVDTPIMESAHILGSLQQRSNRLVGGQISRNYPLDVLRQFASTLTAFPW